MSVTHGIAGERLSLPLSSGRGFIFNRNLGVARTVVIRDGHPMTELSLGSPKNRCGEGYRCIVLLKLDHRTTLGFGHILQLRRDDNEMHS